MVFVSDSTAFLKFSTIDTCCRVYQLLSSKDDQRTRENPTPKGKCRDHFSSDLELSLICCCFVVLIVF